MIVACSRHNHRHYAIKVLNKSKVVQQKQVEHTNSERSVLATVRHPFIVNLWGTFQDINNLFMVMDFVPGGELFTLLRKSRVSAAMVPSMFYLLIYGFAAIPESGSQVLYCRGYPCDRLPSRPRYHLPRSQARKHCESISSLLATQSNLFFSSLAQTDTSNSPTLALQNTSQTSPGHSAAPPTTSHPKS